MTIFQDRNIVILALLAARAVWISQGCGAGAALFGSSGAGAVNLLQLQTKIKNSFLNCRKYVKVSKKYAQSADM